MDVDAQPWAPLCMDASEWLDWQRLNPVLTRQADRAERPCADCPTGYAFGMRALGKCNGTPGENVSEGNGVATLNRPSVVGKQFRDAEVEVSAILPCEKCAHAVVCRIKPVLEARLETLPVTLPTLDPAITFSLTAEVSCSQFLKAKPGTPTGFVTKAAGAHPHYVRTPEHQARISESIRQSMAAKRAAAKAAE